MENQQQDEIHEFNVCVVASIFWRKSITLGYHFLYHLDISLVTFVQLRFCYLVQDLYVSARATLFASPHIPIASTTRRCSVVACLRGHCRIGGISTRGCIRYITRIWLLVKVFSNLSGGGALSSATPEFQSRHVTGGVPDIL